MSEPGPLVGTGRAADVYDIGNGRVLRRYRTDHDSTIEAAGDAGGLGGRLPGSRGVRRRRT